MWKSLFIKTKLCSEGICMMLAWRELGNYCCLDMVVVEEPPGICSNGVHKKETVFIKVEVGRKRRCGF